MDVQKLTNQLKKIDLEEILKNENWKELEDVTKLVFEENGFETIKNFRFKTNRRFEIDVLAIKGDIVICAECKKWSLNRHRNSQLKKACVKNEEKASELKKLMKNKWFLSIIVTLWQEDILQSGKTIIIPIYKLNSFLLNFSFKYFSKDIYI